MHELTICRSLFQLVEQERTARRFSRVRRVRLEIGQFSCLDPDALRHAFAILSRETVLQGATLDIDQPPGRATCLDCGADVELESRLSDCPSCGGTCLQPTGGEQMRLIEMDVD
jgi:hydrogenase nickel incorporation protein HypA/HybF